MSETPGGAGNSVLEHWIQLEMTGRYAKFSHATPEANIAVYGESTSPEYPIGDLDCKCIVIHGGRDDLVDAPKLLRHLPASSVVFEKMIPHHEHMDSLLARDAHEEVFTCIKQQLAIHYPPTGAHEAGLEVALEKARDAPLDGGSGQEPAMGGSQVQSSWFFA